MLQELSPLPLSITKQDGRINYASKSDMIGIQTADLCKPSELPAIDFKTCLLIDGYSLIQAVGKPNGVRHLVIMLLSFWELLHATSRKQLR